MRMAPCAPVISMLHAQRLLRHIMDPRHVRCHSDGSTACHTHTQTLTSSLSHAVPGPLSNFYARPLCAWSGLEFIVVQPANGNSSTATLAHASASASSYLWLAAKLHVRDGRENFLG